ncbi:MAG: hypothetical protein R3F56_16855 [Planctomycetota bacterium]
MRPLLLSHPLALAMALAVSAQDLHPSVRALLEPHGIAKFPPLQRQALDAFVRIEAARARGDLAESARRLAALWRRHPRGGGDWLRCPSNTADLNVGSPPCYYALRMLDDIVAWRRARAAPDAVPTQPTTLAVVLVGKSAGIEPRSSAELEAGGGLEVEHALRAELLAEDSRIVRESLELFADYVEAITGGRAPLRLRIVPLPDLRVRVQTVAKPRRHAGLAGHALGDVWAALPDATRANTDWWWVIYPSHVPEQYPDFVRTEFITGGMTTGPDGASPCFLVDDRWLLRKPPHLGQGAYTDLERRAYLPQWLQHEFFHHLFRTWPAFGLEKSGHQWFDRKTWPEDFEGRIEPDYYAEALHKRLQTQADPPLHVGLRHAAPPAAVVASVTAADLVGSYVRTPRENAWHEGRVEDTGERDATGREVLRWTNAAGRSWPLYFTRGRLELETGAGNPYAHDPGSRTFRMAFARGGDGGYEPRLVGLRFGSELYARQAR